jgi:hypothetical protein
MAETKLYSNIFDYDESMAMFYYLVDNIEWDDGILSKKNGFTRKAKALLIDEDPIIFNFINKAINIINNSHIKSINQIKGVYLNYQRNGNEYTPLHSHKNSIQLVISLGETRHFIVGKNTYELNSGDVIIFGHSIHGVPKQLNVNNGRISIATFAIPFE